MGLSAVQQELLDTIETELHITEPALAGEFATFGSGHACPASPWELGPPKGGASPPSQGRRGWLSWLRAVARRAARAW